MLEEWRPLPDPRFEGEYEVSNHGRVRRIYPDGCGFRILKLGKRTHYKNSSENGHMAINLKSYKTGKQTQLLVKDLVAKAFIGEFMRYAISHKDGNPENNRVDNLFKKHVNKSGKEKGTYRVILPEAVVQARGLHEAAETLGINKQYAIALRQLTEKYPTMIPRIEKLENAERL